MDTKIERIGWFWLEIDHDCSVDILRDGEEIVLILRSEGEVVEATSFEEGTQGIGRITEKWITENRRHLEGDKGDWEVIKEFREFVYNRIAGEGEFTNESQFH